MVSLTSDLRHRLLRGLLFFVILGAVSGGPIAYAPESLPRDGLVLRQQAPAPPSTAATATSAVGATPSQTAQAPITAATTSTTRVRRTSSSASHTTTNASSSSASSASLSSASSGTSTHSTSTTAAAATATTTVEPSIFSSSSKYFGYAIGVLVVVCVFGLLLLVLFIRSIVQLFTKKPQPPPASTTSRAWRYSQDSDMDSAGPIPSSAHPTGQSNLGPRNRDIDNSEMGERRAFLSTDSVTLYPMPKFEEHQKYEDDSGRSHVRSFSSSSGSGTATPYVSRRPMSFLHTPPATHPAFIVDPGSQSGHSAEGPEEVPAPHLLQAVPDDSHTYTNSLLLSRASASEAYRQQTRSSTGVSRAASTASAYSTQPPASIPAVPELPPAWMLSGGGFGRGESRNASGTFEPDVMAALTTMRGSRNGSADSVRIPEGTTAAPTEEGIPPSTARRIPGRAGWGRQAAMSVHGDDLYFLQH